MTDSSPTVEPSLDEAGPVLAYARPDAQQSAVRRAAGGPQPVPMLLDVRESAAVRWGFLLLAWLLTAGFAAAAFTFWVPAHEGVDQNGYLYGGKLIAENLTMRSVPTRPTPGATAIDPQGFVARMWVGFDLDKIPVPAAAPVAAAEAAKEAKEAKGEPKPDDGGVPRYYPKYPAGLPLLYAGLWAGGRALHALVPGWFGPTLGADAAYALSPIATSLAVLGTFLLVRAVAGSVWGIVAMLVFATSETTMDLSVNPNSHASCVMCVVWGFYLVLRFWQSGGSWRALIGGFLIGYAATIRYTEATLLLPLAWVAFQNVRWRKPAVAAICVAAAAGGAVWVVWVVGGGMGGAAWVLPAIALLALTAVAAVVLNVLPEVPLVLRGGHVAATTYGDYEGELEGESAPARPARSRLLGPAFALLGWAIPVVALVAYNWFAMHSITGYAGTNESVGFSWNYFADNWETVLRGLGTQGIYFIFPLAVVGVAALFWRDWRFATMLAGWVVPTVLIYTFYYWAPSQGTNYLRFFLTALPGLVLAAFAMLHWLQRRLEEALPTSEERSRWAAAWPAAVSVATVAVVAGAMFWVTRFDASRALGEPMIKPVYRVLADGSEEGFSLTALAAGLLAAGALAGAAVAAGVSRGRGVVVIGGGLIAALTLAAGLRGNLFNMERDLGRWTSVKTVGDRVLADVPAGSVVFSNDTEFLNYIQFVGDYTLYDLDVFDSRWIKRQAERAPDEEDPNAAQPDPIDPATVAMVARVLAPLTQRDLINRQREITKQATDSGRRVFFAVPLGGREFNVARFSARTGKEFMPGQVRQFAQGADFEPLIRSVIDLPDNPHPRPDGPRPPRNQFGHWDRRYAREEGWELIELVPKPAENADAAKRPAAEGKQG